MRIEFSTRNYTPSDKLKDVVTKKIDRLDKFFEDDMKIKVMLKESNDVKTLELTMVQDGKVLRSEVSGDNMYNLIDDALPKLEKQIIKHRDKIAGKFKKFRMKELAEPIPAPVEKARSVVRRKEYALTPMTVEDAVEELELVGHSFYVFEDRATRRVCVLYRRNDGDYGLIETTV